MIRILTTVCLVFSTAGAVAVADGQQGGPKPPIDSPRPPAKAVIGKKAPAFVLNDLNGKQHSLADHVGRIVVLEWFNAECPFSGKDTSHGIHASSRASTLRKNLKKVDPTIVYLIIDSTARNHTKAEVIEGDKRAVKQWKIDVPILIDFEGTVGRSYDARKTPNMFVIDADGTLRYKGAFDNDRFAEEGDKATNHVLESVKALRAGEVPNPSHIQSWGCGVKY